MKRRVHLVAGAIAIMIIGSFWVATVVSELSGAEAFITQVKILIPWGFVVLVPALAVVGGSGFALARGRSGRMVTAKKKRMPIIAANGLLILMPLAFYLSYKARLPELDAAFYTAQAAELVFGAVNIWLLGANMRDGLMMTRRRRRPVA